MGSGNDYADWKDKTRRSQTRRPRVVASEWTDNGHKVEDL